MYLIIVLFIVVAVALVIVIGGVLLYPYSADAYNRVTTLSVDAYSKNDIGSFSNS